MDSRRLGRAKACLSALGIVLFASGAGAANLNICLTPSSENRIVPIRDNLYQWEHGEWLATFIVTDAGIILIDPLNLQGATWFKAEAARRFNQDVRYLIYSHGHCDHAVGGEVFEKAVIVGQENINAEFTAEDVAAPRPDISYRSHMSLSLGGSTVELFHFGSDHGLSMSYVYYPKARALVTVDVLSKDRLPYRDLHADDPDETIRSLKALEALDFDILLPGHGQRGTKADLAKARGYWEQLRSAVQAGVVAGLSLEQIKKQVSGQLVSYRTWQNYGVWHLANIEGMYKKIAGAAYSGKVPATSSARPLGEAQ